VLRRTPAVRLALVAVLLLAACAAPLRPLGPLAVPEAHLTLLQVNDVYTLDPVDEGRRGGFARLATLVEAADIVIDCSDNFATRHAVNAACVASRKPLVSGAAVGFDAQISVYDTRSPEAPCYACIFPPDAAFEEVRCATMGVFAPLVGIVGSMQAAEALKLLAGVGSSLAGRLQMLDARSMEWSEIRLARQPHCPVCAAVRG